MIDENDNAPTETEAPVEQTPEQPEPKTEAEAQAEVTPTPEEIKEAQKEGILESVRDGANTTMIDVPKGEETAPPKYAPVESNLIEQFTSLGLEGLKKAIDPGAEHPLSDDQVAGILVLERNGKNRTEFVKVLKDRLGIEDIGKELPAAGGPDYTNDVTQVSEL